MEKIKVRIERTFKFVEDEIDGCENCELYDLCDTVEWNECQEGTAGHYELEDEQIDQIEIKP